MMERDRLLRDRGQDLLEQKPRADQVARAVALERARQIAPRHGIIRHASHDPTTIMHLRRHDGAGIIADASGATPSALRPSPC
ncbi:MAG: hypothetical protein WDO24_27460 [Pseudomonadota bacterium]